VFMDNALPLPLKKPPSRASLSKAADRSKADDAQLEAVLAEVRRLRATVAVYRRLVDTILEKRAA
jgi:hypothetical protein